MRVRRRTRSTRCKGAPIPSPPATADRKTRLHRRSAGTRPSRRSSRTARFADIARALCRRDPSSCWRPLRSPRHRRQTCRRSASSRSRIRRAKRASRSFAANQKHVEEAPLLLMFVADLARLRHVAVGADEPVKGLDYTESFLVALADAAFAAQNCFIALESLGLGACYIGAMRNHPREVAEELGLPAGAFVVFGMTIGYPDPEVETGVKPRPAIDRATPRALRASFGRGCEAVRRDAARVPARSIDVRHRMEQTGDAARARPGIPDGSARPSRGA